MLEEDSWKIDTNGRKKKKRSFLQRQKRYGRNGSFGRGTQLSEDVYNYFINIMKTLNTKKEDEDEMNILSTNVLGEIEGKESEYCCNQIISRVVEMILPYSNDEEFCNFIQRFGENLRPIFCDPFGSHVLQQSIIVSYKKYKNSTESKVKEEDGVGKKFYEFILRVSNFLLNNLYEFIWNVYSNAIARTVFNVLSGNPVKGEVKHSEKAKEIKEEKDVEEDSKGNEFIKMLDKFEKRIRSYSRFNDLCNDVSNSGFLQSLLFALDRINKGSELIDKILVFNEENRLDLTKMENSAFARLLEVVLTLSNKSNQKRIYKVSMKENIVDLAKSKSGNFAVQKLILNCRSKKVFGEIYAKLEEEMGQVIEEGNLGVVLAVVKTCRRFEICQGQCMKMLSRVFKMKGPLDIVPTVTSFTPADVLNEKDGFSCTLHGCLIVEEILNFRKPGNVVKSLLAMPDTHLVKLFCDPKGSHIADAFLESSFVGEKNRGRLFKKLQGHYLSLATSKHGSRSLDAIWSATSVQEKAFIAEELKWKQSELCGNVYGKNFAWKIHLDNYRRDKEEWMKVSARKAETCEKYFADILPAKRQKT